MERDRPGDPELIRRVAGALCRDLARTLALPADPVRWSAGETRRFLLRASGEGLLAFALDDPALARVLGEPARREAGRIRLQHLALLADARSISRALAEKEIPHRFVYGLSHARFHPDPGKRPLQDIDVWVGSRDAMRAGRALERLGFARAGHGDAVYRRGLPVPSNVDLLTRVPPLGESLFSEAPGTDRTLKVPVLPPAEALAALLWRALVRQGRFRGFWLLDAAALAGAMPDADWDRFHDIVAEHRLEPARERLAQALAAAAAPPLPERPAAGRRRRPGPLERALTRLWDRGGFPGLGNLVETLWERAPAHRKASRLLRLAWPDTAFMDRRYGRAGVFGRAARRVARPIALAGKGARRALSPRPPRKGRFLDPPDNRD